MLSVYRKQRHWGDHLRDYPEADLRLCFRIWQIFDFLTARLIYSKHINQVSIDPIIKKHVAFEKVLPNGYVF